MTTTSPVHDESQVRAAGAPPGLIQDVAPVAAASSLTAVAIAAVGQTLQASPSAPEAWLEQRPRWDRFNNLRTLLEFGGWACLCLAGLVGERRSISLSSERDGASAHEMWLHAPLPGGSHGCISATPFRRSRRPARCSLRGAPRLMPPWSTPSLA
jgi:hypothetical protein